MTALNSAPQPWLGAGLLSPDLRCMSLYHCRVHFIAAIHLMLISNFCFSPRIIRPPCPLVPQETQKRLPGQAESTSRRAVRPPYCGAGNQGRGDTCREGGQTVRCLTLATKSCSVWRFQRAFYPYVNTRCGLFFILRSQWYLLSIFLISPLY